MKNYFNYFTEIEEHFWKRRGTAMLVSTLDWALIDTWKQAQIPIEAVLRGIDQTFEKYEQRRRRLRKINSLAYCHQAVLAAAEDARRSALPHPPAGEPLPRAELAGFLTRNAAALRKAAQDFEEQSRPESAATFRQLAASLDELAQAARTEGPLDFEDLERRLTVLEEKMLSILQNATPEQELIAMRAEMDRALTAARQKMGAEQIAHLQKQFLTRKLLEKTGLPRLSLFYL
ncbi:MAG: hypothetical protein ACRD88_14195 [Terriglobia bacterium]